MKNFCLKLSALILLTVFSAPAFAITARKHSDKQNTPIIRKELPVRTAPNIVKDETVVIADSKDQPKTQLTKTELTRKEMRQELKGLRKDLKNKNKSNAHGGDMQVLCIIIAFFIPWLGVAIYENAITIHFLICFLLWLLFWLPGFIYALIIILGS